MTDSPSTSTAPRSLVIAPHHDDAEFGCGGIIARSPLSFSLAVVFCSGYQRHRGDPNTIRFEDRIEETTRAMAVLGLLESEWGLFRQRDENTGHTICPGNLAEEITDAVEFAQAADLYIPLPGFNQDHRAVYEAALIALRPRVGVMESLRRVWLYEYPGDAWGAMPDVPRHGARHTILTTDEVDKKLLALSQHETQFVGREAGAVTPNGALALAQFRGRCAGALYAETHYLMREIVR